VRTGFPRYPLVAAPSLASSFQPLGRQLQRPLLDAAGPTGGHLSRGAIVASLALVLMPELSVGLDGGRFALVLDGTIMLPCSRFARWCGQSAGGTKIRRVLRFNHCSSARGTIGPRCL